MAPMPMVNFLDDDFYTGTIEPRVHGGEPVALDRDLVQWVIGGMFYQVTRGLVDPGEDRSERALRQAKAPTDEVLGALAQDFDLDGVEAAATPVLSGLYQQAGRLPADADTFAAELVAGALDDLRRFTGT